MTNIVPCYLFIKCTLLELVLYFKNLRSNTLDSEKKRKEISVCDIQELLGTTLQRFGEMGNHSEELLGNSHSLHKEP